ncbi:MAG TPA: DUF455 family protein [Actinomycetota bacterium]|nr:DUF455 family protein [Actinomycetota bacterium]
MSAPGASMLRLDTATVLRRFHHLERALTLTLGACVPLVGRLDAKAALAKAAWQCSLTAGELRGRVFELRYPDRALGRGRDTALIELYERSAHAPEPGAVLRLLADDLVPGLEAAYARYLEVSDEIADGPSFRFLRTALDEKREQGVALTAATRTVPESEAGTRWRAAMRDALAAVGGVPVEAPVPATDVRLDAGVALAVPDKPARDDRYFACSFYWPDNFDTGFPYGDGIRLLLRTAVSHVNEVWAVDTAGAILYSLGPELGWEFITDAARWLYDESRHMQMGEQRLLAWGFQRAEIPLGSFIYEACAGKSATHRLGMLAFFETKNIGKKAERAETFGQLGDKTSQRDMEFDWADEAIHAGYGRRWLRAALEASGRDGDEWQKVVDECEALVAARIASATTEEKDALRARAEELIAKAGDLLGPHDEGAS